MADVEDTLTPGLKAVAQQAPAALMRAVYEFAQSEILPPAKDRTPVDYGTLRDSGIVDQPKHEGDNISVEVGFGGAAAHYAIYVHEDLEAKHEVGQAKFLSSVMDEKAGIFESWVGAAVARALGL